MTTLFRRAHLPSFGGATAWLNSEPLDAEALRGRVVLVDFWTLTCINWLRTEPWIRGWSQAYRDDGLVVIGVHTPEFGFEQDVDLVRRATAERGVDYPVVVDNDYAVWSAFSNHYWPALYFVDREGAVRDTHVGEGRYEQSERVLQRLLGIDRPPIVARGTGVEAEADWPNVRSPETYLGYVRGEQLASPGGAVVGGTHDYSLPQVLRPNEWALDGGWTVGRENVVADRPDGSISFRFSARDVHLVLSPGASGPIPFRVLLDGEVPAESHGVDVDAQGDGVLDHARMYQLVRQAGQVRERTVEVTFREAGAEAYCFTFG